MNLDNHSLSRSGDSMSISPNFSQLKQILAKISDPQEREIAEAAILYPPRTQRKHIIALLHGMNTDAQWQEALAAQLRDDYGVDTYPIGYGNFRPWRFICPFFTRQAPIDVVTQELRNLKTLHPDADISVIAHSFGTYILSKILEDHTDLNFYRIQLCGAVIDTNYRWDKVQARIAKQIVNDVGHKDIYPLLARKVTWGYGDSGTFGFKKVLIRDRHFNYGHSDFMTEEHVTKYWKPFIVDGQIVATELTRSRPVHGFWVQAVRKLPLKIALLVLVFSGLLLLIWTMAKIFTWAGGFYI